EPCLRTFSGIQKTPTARPTANPEWRRECPTGADSLEDCGTGVEVNCFFMANSLENNYFEGTSNLPLGAGGFSSSNIFTREQVVGAMEEKSAKGDVGATAFLQHERDLRDLQDKVKNEIKNIQSQGIEFERLLNGYKGDLERVNNWVIGAVIGVAVAFFLAVFGAYWGVIMDKDLYLKYNDVYKNYSDQIISQNKEIGSLRDDVRELKYNLQSLRDRNQNLK
ncbi:MAG: hypothetical protein WAU31_02975, partial [Candidatus Moraniibacteriota bacterium]